VHIFRNYYLIEVDTRNDLAICYKSSSGEFINKIPPEVVEYGYTDSFLVAKTKNNYNDIFYYYIIDLSKDFDLAHEDKFRTGPLIEKEYNEEWQPRLKINFIKVD
jgi:hypothetical protein